MRAIALKILSCSPLNMNHNLKSNKLQVCIDIFNYVALYAILSRFIKIINTYNRQICYMTVRITEMSN